MPYANLARQREYQQAWMRKRRSDWLEENGPCRQCGSSVDLEVDHVDRRTKVSHRIWSWSAARRAEELAKCQVLCSVCHLAKTTQENSAEVVHGTNSGYVRYRCRCRECKDAHAERNRRHREEAKKRRSAS
jgi:hypothetical protein